MCDSEAEKILFILNKHERAYRRLIPVYIFLAIVLWILPVSVLMPYGRLHYSRSIFGEEPYLKLSISGQECLKGLRSG